MRLTDVRRLAIVLALCLAGCAPRIRLDPAPGIALTTELARADALVKRGCYACLQEALGLYKRLAATGGVPAAGLRAIDTALLLALRERELGLGSGQALEHAIELARPRPPPFDIGVVRRQEARAGLNGAVAYSNLGEPAQARPLAEGAATHPEMKALAEQLPARLGGS